MDFGVLQGFCLFFSRGIVRAEVEKETRHVAILRIHCISKVPYIF